ncbi:MAG: hypothetical protein AAGJ83_05670 [Planctomycetota bacterium]
MRIAVVGLEKGVCEVNRRHKVDATVSVAWIRYSTTATVLISFVFHSPVKQGIAFA